MLYLSMKKITLLNFILFSAISYAQVGINTSTPDASSALEIESTTGGILIPRMTEDRQYSFTTGLMISKQMKFQVFISTAEQPGQKLMVYLVHRDKGDIGEPGQIGSKGDKGDTEARTLKGSRPGRC